MYINKLDELIKEFQAYNYYELEELEEDISKIEFILNLLKNKGVSIELNFDDI